MPLQAALDGVLDLQQPPAEVPPRDAGPPLQVAEGEALRRLQEQLSVGSRALLQALPLVQAKDHPAHLALRGLPLGLSRRVIRHLVFPAPRVDPQVAEGPGEPGEDRALVRELVGPPGENPVPPRHHLLHEILRLVQVFRQAPPVAEQARVVAAREGVPAPLPISADEEAKVFDGHQALGIGRAGG